jgi:hypothetical protein
MGAPLNESKKSIAAKSFTKKYFEQLNETKNGSKESKSFFDLYMNLLSESQKKEEGETPEDVIDYDIKNATLQESIKNICDKIDSLVDEDEINREEIINEAMSDLGDFSGETITD